MINAKRSIVFDILGTSIDVCMMKECIDMMEGKQLLGKTKSKNMVWSRAWEMEDTEWDMRKVSPFPLITWIMAKPAYMTWWVISDRLLWTRPKSEKNGPDSEGVQPSYAGLPHTNLMCEHTRSQIYD